MQIRRSIDKSGLVPERSAKAATVAEVEPAIDREAFSPALQAFFRQTSTWAWASQFQAALFIRDHHDLPVSSPHDIDLMIDADLHGQFIDLVRQKAQEADLYCFSRRVEDACFIILFDLDASTNGRAWAYLEVRDGIQLTPERVLRAADIETEFHPVSGVPVPTSQWQVFLEIFQAARTGNLAKAELVLKHAGLDPDAARDLFQSFLGLEVHFAAPLGNCDEQIEQIARRIVKRRAKQEKQSGLSLRTRLNQFLFRNFYCWHYAKPLLFTIHGPDGVGKTTTCEEVEKIFVRLPLPFDSFHHITGWKYDNKKPAEKRAGSSNDAKSVHSAKPGLVYRVTRWVYRRLPADIQTTYVTAQGYNMYLRKLNELIYMNYCRNRTMFVDRYIYDMATKNMLKGIGRDVIHTLFVRLARNPLRAFILTDEPDAIHKRKQELTIQEIEEYQSKISDIMRRRGVVTETVRVGGRRPQAVARIIVEKILDDCSFTLLAQIRAGK